MSATPRLCALALLLAWIFCDPIAAARSDSEQSRPKVLPVPKRLEPQPGYCSLAGGIALVASDPVLIDHARVLAGELRQLFDLDVILVGEDALDGDGAASAAARRVPLVLALRPEVRPAEGRDPAGVQAEHIDESYALDVEPAAMRIEAATPTGVAWGSATLLQWIQVRAGLGPGAVCVEVRDEPASPFRAVMIDVARAPHSIDMLRGVVRAARLLKLRFVHLHLTDDQSFTLPFEPVTSKLEPGRAYSREQIAQLVEYARVRGVVLIPEIDLPGHSGKLIQSGFLPGARNHADVASEEHWPGVRTVIDAAIDQFPTSPYFHIGGDESGAGSALVPFLQRVNQHVRSRGKRLLVWEGFHGAPLEAIPATGPDRVVVAAWESSYNPPWDLLAAGYSLVNASWKPLYVVGGHGRLHPGVSAGRKWSPDVLARWSKDRFMHWEPGRPVFEGRGPLDADPLDLAWSVPEKWRERMLGGQLCFWEQRASSVLGDLAVRAPVLAERLWNGEQMADDILVGRLGDFARRPWALVQPVGIAVPRALPGPMDQLGHWLPGEAVHARVVRRSHAEGELRCFVSDLGDDWNWIDGGTTPARRVEPRDGVLELEGNLAVRLGLYAADGSLVGSETHLRLFQGEPRVSVREFDLGPSAWPQGASAAPADFDLDAAAAGPPRAQYSLPMLRGPLAHLDEHAQRLEATLVAPFDGPAQLGLQTQSGSAVLWLDADRDGTFGADERLLGPSPNSEALQTAIVDLVDGESYALRVDHFVRLPRPVLLVSLDRPGAERPAEITRALAPME